MFIPIEIFLHISGYCTIAEYFVFCFVSKKIKTLTRKKYKSLYKQLGHDKYAICDQLTSTGSVNLLDWYNNLYGIISDYGYAINTDTLEYILDKRFKNKETNLRPGGLNKSGSLEVYTWLIEHSYEYYVNIPMCAKYGYYQILNKMNYKEYVDNWASMCIDPESGNYELLCWMMPSAGYKPLIIVLK
jgi:hypothetical protein